MYDQSFGESSLFGLFRDSDLSKMPHLAITGKAVASAAAAHAEAIFGGTNPLQELHVRGKQVYRSSSFQDELILRKVTHNIRRSFHQRSRGRRFIVETLVAHLAEGLPYRVYKRDVHRFYPSFLHQEVQQVIESDGRLSWLTKRLVERILAGHTALNGTGLPVGLGLSAVLSELMMRTFDEKLKSNPHVRFYARYVDDIVLITNGEESEDEFSRLLRSSLPRGLSFNSLKTFSQETDPPAPAQFMGIHFCYLGYSIRVETSTKEQLKTIGRKVDVDLSPAKTKKIKTRIVRALRAHSLNPDFALLKKRIAFLASNTSLPVAGQSVRRLVGIYHTYPLITVQAGSMLHELDRFCRYLVLSPKGRSLDGLAQTLTRSHRSQLLGLSFLEGYTKRRFISVSRVQLGAIRKCWANE